MLVRFLNKHIKRGAITVHLANGQMHHVGHGLPRVEWVFKDDRCIRRILRYPALELGQTYMEGAWDIKDNRLLEFLQILLLNFPERKVRYLPTFLRDLVRLIQQWNNSLRSHKNVAHHYDLHEQLFRTFLDREMHYSCAYFQYPEQNLDQAQEAKCAHIMNKLHLEPGQKILDIGSGWGGLALYLAEHRNVRVTGLTLSKEQLRIAQKRAEEMNLSSRVQFLLEDYRKHTGAYDRIVSVGMFEHVGKPQYPKFFDQIKGLLEDDGVALLHTIGRYGTPGFTNPWIRKYIFPGGYNPSLSEICNATERNELVINDIEVLRLHYAETLAAWRERFGRNWYQIRDNFDQRFYRMWQFYLASCEVAFRHWDLVVFQVQLTKQIDVLPTSRDYMYQKDLVNDTKSTRWNATG